MLATKQRGTVAAATPKNNHRIRCYHSSGNRSSKKTREQLGGLLLALQKPLSPKRKQQPWRVEMLRSSDEDGGPSR